MQTKLEQIDELYEYLYQNYVSSHTLIINADYKFRGVFNSKEEYINALLKSTLWVNVRPYEVHSFLHQNSDFVNVNSLSIKFYTKLSTNKEPIEEQYLPLNILDLYPSINKFINNILKTRQTNYDLGIKSYCINSIEINICPELIDYMFYS